MRNQRNRTVRLALVVWVALVSVPFLVVTGRAIGSDAGPGVSGWEALTRLQTGNKRFVTGDIQYRPDPQSRGALAAGQQPHTVVVSCSDSRVAPELVFDQGLGEIFTIRAAGNVLDDYGIASIEYAVEHLGSRLVLVLGHESCGAVKAAISTPRGQSSGSPALDHLVGDIQKNLNSNMLFSSTDPTLSAPVRTNVEAVTRDLLSRSPVLRHAIESNALIVAQGIYSLSSGQVNFWYAGLPELPRAAVGSDHGHAHTAVKRVPPKKKKHAKKKPPAASEGHQAGTAPAAGFAPVGAEPGMHGASPAQPGALAPPDASPLGTQPALAAPPGAGSPAVGNPFDVPPGTIPAPAPQAAPTHSSEPEGHGGH